MELFDAYDEHGYALGYELVRGDVIPIGVYHKIVQIYTLDQSNRVLITQRHPSKHFGYYWEITAGSVIKGEDELYAAIRELYEETGICIASNNLQLIKSYLGQNSIWFSYIHKVNMEEQKIKLAQEETIDYRFIPIEEFYHMIDTKQFPKPFLDHFMVYQKRFDEMYTSLLVK